MGSEKAARRQPSVLDLLALKRLSLPVHKLIIFVEEGNHLAPQAVSVRLEGSVAVSCKDPLLRCPEGSGIEVIALLDILELVLVGCGLRLVCKSPEERDCVLSCTDDLRSEGGRAILSGIFGHLQKATICLSDIDFRAG